MAKTWYLWNSYELRQINETFSLDLFVMSCSVETRPFTALASNNAYPYAIVPNSVRYLLAKIDLF